MFEAGFAYVLSQSLMNTRTKITEHLMMLGYFFVLERGLNPKGVRSVKKTIR